VIETDTWLATVPADLREHLSLALGNRTTQIAHRVAAVLTSSRPGDDDYLQRLRANGYQLSDEGSEAVFAGPTLIVARQHDRIAGYADQFGATRLYPQASFAAIAGAGRYLPFERPEIFASLVGNGSTGSRWCCERRHPVPEAAILRFIGAAPPTH
jgi:pimeloyl-ACP methyl ester carboxylesterase